MMSFPHRFDPCQPLNGEDGQDHAERVAMMASWCYHNIGNEDWLHDPRSFEFRNADDLAWFVMVCC